MRPIAVQPSVALLGALGFGVALLAAPVAGAEEPVQVAQAEQSEAPAAPDPPPRQKPPANSGIEEIVVRGAESDAAGDFEAADSVTGFGAEDLAALGAKDIADLAAFTPNLEIVTSGATTPTFFIRGVGLNDFNSNSTGAVAIYQDDVPINAPAIQLGSLFDVEAVNILRGPQGTGLARNASAGAIKIYSRKPSGGFGAFLRSDYGNYTFRDFEGAIEAPIYEDLLAGRFSFRLTKRDGTMENRCGNASLLDASDPLSSFCGERALENILPGLQDPVNNIDNWAGRGTLLFQPTLDMSWLLNAHGSRRSEFSRLGQSYGTQGFFCIPGLWTGATASALDNNCDPPLPSPPFESRNFPIGARVNGVLGGLQSSGYQPPEVRERLIELAPCLALGTCNQLDNRESLNSAKVEVAQELARDLDSEPWAGDFNLCDPRTSLFGCEQEFGKTINDTWGTFVKGDIALPLGMQLSSVTGYDNYDRFLDIDLDFSPETLFHITTIDQGWQATQDLRLQGQFGDRYPVRWDIGGYFLREQLNVEVVNDLGANNELGFRKRDYTQDVFSAAGYVSLSFDFLDDFTLDGGFRYNWENKKIDFIGQRESDLRCLELPPDPGAPCVPSLAENLDTTWTAPTGTIRLTYRFREDTHAFWKYTRGWKPGTYNATSSDRLGVTIADPETIDSFEAGVRGSWLDGRLGIDASFFYYSYSDYQIFTAQQFIGGQPEFIILNANDAEVYGSEIDLVTRPWSGAFANVRFAWLESQFLDFVQENQQFTSGTGNADIVTRELQNSGNRLLNSPRFKVSLTGEQTLPLGRWGSLTARYDGTWTDVNYFDATEGRGIPNADNIQFLPEDTIAQRPFWLHNVRLSYRPPSGRFEIAGWGRNIANKAYKTFGFDGSTFRNTTIYFVGDPRTYGGSIVVNF